ncbi:MAG: hypothetical protein V7L27_04060 [Nostoc sp.]|uniref:hypothetical protein n=1 Tax=Nostoc sp. TaxID=1180 RepID=UPI002FFCD80A
MLEKTSTFQKAIEAVEALDPEAQAILVDIIQKRLKQQRRDDLLLDEHPNNNPTTHSSTL